ncbi:MAG: phosphoribosylformylglycinamidine synthase subunit PurS [Bacteroidetes bacterium]|jgi:phosphoribosylformylglycinamidine synthase|nr:phosphoribosylformylglycinamidine synthase subunit PurS [Bacteroidota bacterium]MDA0903868.1 phosphoribosylformylglycinamidine synthase subunit PurS [Bacteroidota bacterium]MDA0940877.1 phosphoribosylformylglycinamidine synthase subunit PurS [Bacteroidota bacterium]MDA1243167.1 phosphoribosylformylglycinamidine synthase subunit PurS [Bacteroidota bacterium]
MKFRADIDIMPLPALLDPQGKAVGNNLPNIGLSSISNVRIGKHITLEVEASSQEVAEAQVNEACTKLLVNEIMEGFSFRLEAL